VSKNSIMTRDGNVVLPLAVAAGTVAGEVLTIGDQGLIGYALTDEYDESAYTTETIAVPPQGLADGEASVEIPGVSRVVKLTVAGGVDLGDPVFISAQDTYSATASDNTFIGWALEDIAAGEEGLVGLAQFVPAAVTT
jgi:hypothetical protein